LLHLQTGKSCVSLKALEASIFMFCQI